MDFFTEWITEACTYWEQNEDIVPSVNFGCFLFEFASLVSKNEARFLQLSGANTYLRLCDVFHVRKSGCAVEIKVAYVKLMETFLGHKYVV